MMTTLKPKRKIAQRHEEELQREINRVTKLIDTLHSQKKIRTSNKNPKKKELVLRKEIETLKNENAEIQETCYSYQNENIRLQSSLKLKEKQTADLTKTMKSKERQLKNIHKKMKKLSTDNEKKTAVINNLEEITSSQKKEIEELQVRKEEIDKCLQDTRQACIRLFNSKVDRRFAEKYSRLITEVQKAYNSNSHLDKIQYCPAMLYINSVQVSKSSELLIDESSDEPSIKRRKMNEDTRYSSFNIKSLEALVMNLEYSLNNIKYLKEVYIRHNASYIVRNVLVKVRAIKGYRNM
uniref:AsIV-cont00100-ORF1 n=1 Tax=Apophua simplicipes ichnovirus TaxID=1329648 RepID=S5DMN6_9VIRU|nr:AsIV-cont00100-ORF1 [Apophua simplicipes ichnovirus]